MAQVQGISINNPRYLDTSITTKSKAVVQTTNISLPIEKNSSLKSKTVSGKLYLKLDLGEDLVLKKGAGELGEVTVSIKYKFTDETTWKTLDLTIINDIVERLEIIDLTNDLDSHTGTNAIIDIAVDGIATTTTSVYFNNLINNNLRLKATFLRTYNVGVRTPNNALATAVTLSSLDGSIIGRRANFKWTTDFTYPNYEFQLLKLINRDTTVTSDSITNNVRIDWSKALSIETQSYKKQIDIIIAEGTGLYTWRVRPIGTFYKGGIANSDNYGNWSTHYTQNSVINLNHTDANVFFFKDPDEKLNWNYSRVFTEGDNIGENGVRISEGMTYADGLLRTRQSQQYNSADSTTIISQTISDYSGRPSLTTLPVPIANRDLSGYKENFVKNDSIVSTIYTAKDFDADGNFLEPRKIKDSGAFSYYNGDNAEGVADAQGFSYSRTLFKTDGTGRATESSGVGQKHALGKRTDGKGRTTRVYYSSPSDQELIRIFGDEAPLSESVIRTTTIDPNDVISIAYTSKEGKTIATALLSTATENLQKLGGDTIIDHNFEVINSTNQNVLSNGKFISKKRIAIVANQTEVTLGYFLYDVAAPCSGGCNYKLKFYLTDLSNNQTYKSPLFAVDSFAGNFTFVDVNNASNTYVVSNGLFTLNSGEYMMTKEVYSANNPSLIATAAMDRADQIEDVLQIIADSMSLVDNDADLVRFQAFLSNPNNGLVFPSGFSVTYENGIKITDVGASNSNSGGSCSSCGSTTVSLPIPDSCYFCTGTAGSIGLDSIRNNATAPITINSLDWNSIKSLVDDYFIKALNYKVNGDSSISIPTDSLYKYAPGFTTNSLSYMITNMLASKYYTGKKIKIGADYFRAEENENGVLAAIDSNGVFSTETEYTGSVSVSYTNDLEYNYDCEELYNCWTKSINMIKNFEFDDDANLMDGYNDSQGSGEAEEQSDSDDAQEGSGGGSKLMDFIISRKLRKFNDSDGETSKSELESIVSLPNLFLSCAGRQFSEVIDDDVYTNLPSDYSTHTPYLVNGTTTYNGNSAYLFNSSEYDASDVASIPFSLSLSIGAFAPKLMKVADTAEVIEVYSCDDLSLFEQGGNLLHGNNANIVEHNLLYYRYILKPEWMFKYFVYNSINDYNNSGGDSIYDDNHIIVPQRSIEIATNYNKPNTGCTSCFESNIYYHDSWNSGQLLNFYQLIKGGKKSSIECPKDATDSTQTFDVDSLRLSSSELLERVRTELDDAKKNCNGKSGEIRGGLISALNNACYEVVECNADPLTQVSELGVDRMVDAVIEKCIAKVNTVTLHIFDNIDMLNADYSDTYNYGDSPYGNPYSSTVTIDNNEGVNFGYPLHTIESCCYLDETGGIIDSYKRNIILFPTCDQTILDQINYWSFAPYIAPRSGCSNTPPEWKPACPSGDCGTQNCTNGNYTIEENVSSSVQ